MEGKVYKIYKITNKTTNKLYVGFTSQTLGNRFAKHCTSSNMSELGQDIRRLGRDNFIIEVIEESNDLIDAMILELVNIKKLNTLAPTGYNSLYTDHSKAKIRNKQKGVSLTFERKRLVSLGLTGLKQSPETIQKRINYFYKPIEDQYGTIYFSIKQASEELSIPIPSICHVLSGKTKHPRHGFKFSFVKGEI